MLKASYLSEHKALAVYLFLQRVLKVHFVLLNPQYFWMIAASTDQTFALDVLADLSLQCLYHKFPFVMIYGAL